MTKKPKKWTLSELPITFWSISVLVVVALIIVAITSFHRLNTERILAVADKFIPNPSWELATDSLEPSRFLCLNSVPCPSIHRAWRTGEPLTRDELEQLLKQSNLSLSVSGDCKPHANQYGGVAYCRAEGIINNMEVSIRVTASLHDKKDNQLVLSIRMAR